MLILLFLCAAWQSVSCEEGSCCVSESVTQEKPESGQTPNITQALAATPVHTQSMSKPVTVTQLINAYTDNTDKEHLKMLNSLSFV